jgi:hypothetical protein
MFVFADNGGTHRGDGRFTAVVPEGRMRFQRALRCQAERCAARAATSGGRQCVHSLHVPRHGDETPLTLDIIEAAQKELAENPSPI